MKPGDIQTVLRCEKHSLTSTKGVIFEEVSTNNIKNDSYFENPKVKGLDSIERKTILKIW